MAGDRRVCVGSSIYKQLSTKKNTIIPDEKLRRLQKLTKVTLPLTCGLLREN